MESNLPSLVFLTRNKTGLQNEEVTYIAKRGYYVTKGDDPVYDVQIKADENVIAVVGFKKSTQTEGALYKQYNHISLYKWQDRYGNDIEKIKNVARVYARSNTGWDLRYPIHVGPNSGVQGHTEIGVRGGQGTRDDPIELSSDDESSVLAPPLVPSITVTVQLFDLALHPTKRNIMSGYVTFFCTVTRAHTSISGYMGAHVTANRHNEWSFPTFSEAVSINMVQPSEKYLNKYMCNARNNNGRDYVRSGKLVNEQEHTSLVKTLVTAMQAVGTMRASNGEPQPELRTFLMEKLNLNERRAQRENRMYGDTSLSGLDWAFAPADAWRRVLDGEADFVYA